MGVVVVLALLVMEGWTGEDEGELEEETEGETEGELEGEELRGDVEVVVDVDWAGRKGEEEG